MKNIFYTAAALTIVTAFFASPAFATPPHGHSDHVVVSHGHYNNYHVNYGVRFSNGYYYRGRNHYHWGVIRYDARYRCQCYWDPYACSWYYYCVPANCYYPVSYCPYGTYSWPSGGPVAPGGPISPAVPVPTSPGNIPPIPTPVMP